MVQVWWDPPTRVRKWTVTSVQVLTGTIKY